MQLVWGVPTTPENAGEFAEYVKAGLTPAEAIATATVNAASVLGLLGDSGTLEVGKRADMIAVSTSPLQDVRALEDVQMVIRGGDVVKSTAAVSTTTGSAASAADGSGARP